MNPVAKKIFLGFFLISSCLLISGEISAQQTWEVDVSGEEYNPKELSVSPGDTIRFCNQGMWRRQPFSTNEYNRFSNRNPETFEMLKKGECKGVRVQNPTRVVLNFNVRDAVALKAKLKVTVSPKTR